MNKHWWFKQQMKHKNWTAKVRQINQYVLQNVRECKTFHKISRASQLQALALWNYIRINESALKFKESKSWLARFKTRNKISYRKITRLVSKQEVQSVDEIITTAKNFQGKIIQLSTAFDWNHIINTDQCGFQYEITLQWIYTFKGDKQMFSYAHSLNNLSTHSYTVQYIMRMEGNIIGNVLMCL